MAGAAIALGPLLPGALGVRAGAINLTFVALVLEAMPFLLVGALVASLLERRSGLWLLAGARRFPRLAAAVSPLAGIGLPLCDCGLVPLARRLERAGVGSPVINGFVGGAPLTNPIVIVSTLVAFPGRPEMAWARVGAGVAVGLLAGWLAPRPSRPVSPGLMSGAGDAPVPMPIREAEPHCCETDRGLVPGDDRAASEGGLETPSVVGASKPSSPRGRSARLADTVVGELIRTGPALVLGALAAAVLKNLLPASMFTTLNGQPLLAAAVLMVLAFVMSICSQADAFVASSLPVGPLPRLGFLVLGPVLDLKLAVLYRREFGGRWLAGYAAVVVPAVLVAVTVAATMIR